MGLVVIDVRADEVAAGFLGVEGIVLDRRNDLVRLDALDLGADNRAGQQRVFAAIFEITTVARFAQQVDAAGQLHVEAGIAGFGTDHGATLIGKVQVPGGSRRQARGQGGAFAPVVGIVLGGDADTGIGLILGRDVETRNTRNITCRRPA